MSIGDLTQLAVLCGLVVAGAQHALKRAWPLVRPVLRWSRNYVLRDILHRVDELEDRVDIVEAIQAHERE